MSAGAGKFRCLYVRKIRTSKPYLDMIKITTPLVKIFDLSIHR